FELPSDRAYSETCAAIGSVMLGWRLLLATGREDHADQIERALFNVVATAPDAAGTSFFYVNPLQRNVPGVPALPDEPSPRAASSQRAPWFEVSCCPTNTARTLASLAGYVASTDETGIRIHQYAPAEITTTLRDGAPVRLRVTTEYPLDGRIAVEVLEAPAREWTLTLRIPGWARGAAVIDAPRGAELGEGVVTARGRFAAGDVVRLTLPVEPRFTFPDPRIDAIRGSVAVEAGPLVYCLESVDAPEGIDLARVAVRPDAALVREGDLVRTTVRIGGGADAAWAYAPTEPAQTGPAAEVALIPYHRWAERGPSTMRVWLPVQPASAVRPGSTTTPEGEEAHP
ncbi:MAG: glycoside hydrolase family 127 protein, partial [Protaetiibacter sp.]